MTVRRSIIVMVAFFFFVVGVVFLLSNFFSDQKIVNRFSFWKQHFFVKENIVQEEFSFVKRVIDGDTVELENGEKVRYIGINTPESVDPRRAVECFGKEASEFNKALVAGKKVKLVRDVSERDKYGRLLRFVYLEDGTFINEVLIREGYAFVSTYPPDVLHAENFREVELQAREKKRGLWSVSACNGKK